jgi:hypothetical protein
MVKPDRWWLKTDEARARARERMLRLHRDRPNRPYCGARRKYDGQPCQNEASENGRCRFHGGRTPKGKNWHKVTWNKTKRANRLAAKLDQLAKRENARNARLAAMTREERANYDHWHQQRPTGSLAERAQKKAKLEAKNWLSGILNDSKPETKKDVFE